MSSEVFANDNPSLFIQVLEAWFESISDYTPRDIRLNFEILRLMRQALDLMLDKGIYPPEFIREFYHSVFLIDYFPTGDAHLTPGTAA